MYLATELRAALLKDGFFTVVTREQLETILQEQKLQLTELVDPRTRARVEGLAGVQAVLKGTLWIVRKADKEFIQIKGELYDLSAVLRASANAEIPAESVPVAVKPPQFEVALAQVEQAGRIEQQISGGPAPAGQPGSFQVRVWLEGAQPIYSGSRSIPFGTVVADLLKP